MRAERNFPASTHGSQENGVPELGVCARALVEFDNQPGRLVISVYGQLDAASAVALDNQHLRQIAATGTHTVVDLAGLTSAEPAGLSVLMRRQQLATRAGCRVHLRIAPAQVPALLEAEATRPTPSDPAFRSG